MFLLFCHIGELPELVACLPCLGYHGCHEVVGVDDSALSRLHLSVGQLDHAVREVDKVFTPLEPELVEEDGENLEVVVLLIADNVYHLVDREVLETQLGGSDILCHVYRCAVRAQQELLVEALGGEVGPD